MAELVRIDGGAADRATTKPRTDGPSSVAASEPWGSIDCQGSEEQINDCIINASTKSGIPATRSRPTVTYQTCGAQ